MSPGESAARIRSISAVRATVPGLRAGRRTGDSESDSAEVGLLELDTLTRGADVLVRGGRSTSWGRPCPSTETVAKPRRCVFDEPPAPPPTSHEPGPALSASLESTATTRVDDDRHDPVAGHPLL